jgi:hypothetical protein
MMFDRLLSVQFEEASEGTDQEQQTWWDRDKGHEQRRCCGGASPASCCPKERVSWERSRTRIDPDADGRVLCLALRFDRGWGEHEQKLSGQRFTSIHSPTIENTERKVVNASPAEGGVSGRRSRLAEAFGWPFFRPSHRPAHDPGGARHQTDAHVAPGVLGAFTSPDPAIVKITTALARNQ